MDQTIGPEGCPQRTVLCYIAGGIAPSRLGRIGRPLAGYADVDLRAPEADVRFASEVVAVASQPGIDAVVV